MKKKLFFLMSKSETLRLYALTSGMPQGSEEAIDKISNSLLQFVVCFDGISWSMHSYFYKIGEKICDMSEPNLKIFMQTRGIKEEDLLSYGNED